MPSLERIDVRVVRCGGLPDNSSVGMGKWVLVEQMDML